jgi:hypothetical protein
MIAMLCHCVWTQGATGLLGAWWFCRPAAGEYDVGRGGRNDRSESCLGARPGFHPISEYLVKKNRPQECVGAWGC